ncbi:MAG TPA: YidC/Oxa1 family membrane protein insertase [Acidimicrobiales bacterium]|nr:YidC/Oxa1 family membrane protein insertase [Acidimicrobiales bacterium]
MLDGLFELVSGTLNFFYELIPNYAVAIALLTLVVMIITTPLTLKGTRSMIEMQRLQPQIRRIQTQYRDDRQKLNEELMAFYREHQINPVGGCLPLLIQAPVFSILYWVVRGLTNPAKFVAVQKLVVAGFPALGAVATEGFRPKYLDSNSELYVSLAGQDHMDAFGVDLSQSMIEALSGGFLHAMPYALLVAVIAVLSWYQQKQIMGRNAGVEMTQQQQMMTKLGPALYVFFAAISPGAIGIYFLVSTLWRVGQQYHITRSLYSGEDSVGVQAQRAMAEARQARQKEPGPRATRPVAAGNGAQGGGAGRTGAKSAAKVGAAKAVKGSRNGSGGKLGAAAATGTAAAAARSTPAKSQPHPRSRKKKKRK